MIRPHDLVRLRHTPAWTGRVITVADAEVDQALVEVARSCLLVWFPVELLELVPGQIERLAA